MKLLDRVPYLIRTLGLVWKAAKGWTAAWILLLLLQGLLPVAILYLTRRLVDALAGAIGGGMSFANFQPVLVNGLLVAGVLVLTEALQVCAEWVRIAQSELVQDHISALVQDKSVSLDLAFFENAEFYDRRNLRAACVPHNVARGFERFERRHATRPLDTNSPPTLFGDYTRRDKR